MAPRGVRVGNLTTDWNDGTALCALVDYNVNGIYDLYQGIVSHWKDVGVSNWHRRVAWWVI